MDHFVEVSAGVNKGCSTYIYQPVNVERCEMILVRVGFFVGITVRYLPTTVVDNLSLWSRV